MNNANWDMTIGAAYVVIVAALILIDLLVITPRNRN